MFFIKMYDNVLMDDKLNATEKILYSKILQLHSRPRGCVATNQAIADSIGVSFGTIKQSIPRLKRMKYIDIVPGSNELGTERLIVPLKYLDTQERSFRVIG